jgi:pyridoxamine 5'-phosphate oxidase
VEQQRRHHGHSPGHDPAVMREQYREVGITVGGMAADPFIQFSHWFAEAVNGGVAEPNAMVVSTAEPGGRPSSRTVLLKGYDHRGFVFFTNYRSRKSQELAANPRASLLFPWVPLARQVIVEGDAERVSREESEVYFRSRPYGSRIGAWASEQSAVISGRQELERRYEELATRYPQATDVPVPPFWGGFRVRPLAVEFWQGRENRLHDRLVYVAEGDGWRLERLAP